MSIDLPNYADSYKGFASQVIAIPKLGNIFSYVFNRPLIKLYKRILLEVTGYQSYIHNLTVEDANKELKSLESFHSILKKIEGRKDYFRNSELGTLIAIVHQVNIKLNENIFLLNTVISGEFDKTITIDEMLEDYYDGLEADNRKYEEKIPLDEFLKLV